VLTSEVRPRILNARNITTTTLLQIICSWAVTLYVSRLVAKPQNSSMQWNRNWYTSFSPTFCCCERYHTPFCILPPSDTSRLLPGTEDKGRFSCETFPLCNPRHFLHRCSLLILMCFLSFGSYYVYDNPAALTRTIRDVRDPCAYAVSPYPRISIPDWGFPFQDQNENQE